MNPVKRFFLYLAAAYVVLSALIMIGFGPPRLSGAYLDEYEADHDRYVEIIYSEEYKRHMQNPVRHPADEELQADIEFVREYEARPEFQRANFRRRMSQFLFEVLNAGVIVVVAVRFGTRPLLSFLDERIGDLRKRIAWADEARKEAEKQKQTAQDKLDQLDDVRRNITQKTHDVIEQEQEAIEEATEQNIARIDAEAEERMRVEELQAAQQVKAELIDKAAEELKERYQQRA